ncbi:MAG TPA: Hsp20/alpha crystallin family protein [Anaerolineales bacterium]|nr:Hsp20/alpha crystallin family protein [Anaerolineales bacterium]
MPTIVRKSLSTASETRREVLYAVSWHVRSTWSPPTDVYETENSCVIKLEIAGMKDEDFEVAFENNILMISGNRPDLNERRAYHQMEIRFGKFEIAVEIPVKVDMENATAEYKDGFLVIVLPRSDPNQGEVG